MKKLITEKDITDIIGLKDTVYIDEETIVTALAKDVAKSNNIDFAYKGNEEVTYLNEPNKSGETCQSNTKNQCKESSNNIDLNDPILSANEIYQMLKYCIDDGLFTEEDLLKYKL